MPDGTLQVEGPEGAPKKTDPGSDTDYLADITQTADDLRAAMVALQGMLVDIESGKLNTVLTGFEASTAAIVDRITLRGAMLIGAFLVALICYRIVTVKLIKAPR